MWAVIIYDAAIGLYRAVISLLAFTGHRKARLWVQGRRGWQARLEKALAGNGPLIWVHAASLGEFEQGRPVLEALRRQHPGHRILLTFFSPSGYEVRKNYAGADHVDYLPLDTRRNARRFLAIARPRLVLFIKYEFWYHFMTALHRQQAPVLLVSGIFRPGQPFFRFYGGMFRRLLRQLTHIFVQNNASRQYLQQINVPQVTVAGDTRFDRVWALRQEAAELPLIAQFCNGRQAVVAGSTWEQDENALAAWWNAHPANGRCLIIAPHEIGESGIARVLALFPGAARFSESGWRTAPEKNSVLVIDNVGMLSALYRYGQVAFVGGGFGRGGIHNILEPATYGKPVVFGPVYEEYAEAVELLALGGAFSVPQEAALAPQLEQLLGNEDIRRQAGAIAGRYVADNQGATAKILAYIQEKRFLSSE